MTPEPTAPSRWTISRMQTGLVALMILLMIGLAGYRAWHPRAAVQKPETSAERITADRVRLSETEFAPGLGVTPAHLVQGPEGVAWIERRVGTGSESVNAGRRVWVRYAAYLPNGQLVDESRAHGDPFAVVVGTHGVRPAWDLGVLGMRVGGVRLILAPTIRADGVLAYRVELVQVEIAPTPAPRR